MHANDLRILHDYNYWANARVLGAAALVGQDQLIAPAGVGHGSLRGTLVHILSAEWGWRQRCQEGVSPGVMLSERDLPTLAAIQDLWRAEEHAMRTFLAGLDDADMARSVAYTTTRGVPYENTLWHLLAHVVNHGTQHRAEAAVLLTGYGRSPGDLDFITFLRGK